MIPVDQTRFGCNDPNEPADIAPGNCWAACLASILEKPLNEIPDELNHWKPGMKPWDSWIPYQKEAHKWLHSIGYVLVEIRMNNVFYAGPEECFDMYCIQSGPSPRNPKCFHAVVAKGPLIVHDPHPSRLDLAGELKDRWYEFLVKR